MWQGNLKIEVMRIRAESRLRSRSRTSSADSIAARVNVIQRLKSLQVLESMGFPISLCQKTLDETDGDEDAALVILRAMTLRDSSAGAAAAEEDAMGFLLETFAANDVPETPPPSYEEATRDGALPAPFNPDAPPGFSPSFSPRGIDAELQAEEVELRISLAEQLAAAAREAGGPTTATAQAAPSESLTRRATVLGPPLDSPLDWLPRSLCGMKASSSWSELSDASCTSGSGSDLGSLGPPTGMAMHFSSFGTSWLWSLRSLGSSGSGSCSTDAPHWGQKGMA